MKTSRAAAVLALAATLASGCADPPLAPPVAGQLQFDFHSSLLMNLHHRLYGTARNPPAPDALDKFQPSDGFYAWIGAQRFYDEHYAHADLLFDDGMRDIRHALAKARNQRTDAHGLGLPPDLADVLSDAARGYEQTDWPSTDQFNLDWIAHVQALNALYGAAIQPELERAFGARFPPRIRDDVVYDTGTPTGAYTDEPPPQSVIPSSRGSYMGDAALEMIWHEAAHAGVTDALEAAIAAEVKAQHRQPADQLWHAVQFYTVGYVTQQAFRRHGVDYVPYATKNHVYGRGWAAYLPIIESEWQPWLDGRGTMQEAVKAMVAKLAPAP